MLFILVCKEDLPGRWTFFDTSAEGIFYLFICVATLSHIISAIHTIKPDLLLLELPPQNALSMYDRLQSLPELTNTPAIISSKIEPDGKLTQQLQERQLVFLKRPYGQDHLLQVIKDLCSPPGEG